MPLSLPLHSLLSSTFTLFMGLSVIFGFHKFVLKQRAETAAEKEEVMRQARFIVGCKCFGLRWSVRVVS